MPLGLTPAVPCSSPRYIVDLGSGLLSSLTPAELEQAAGTGAVAPAAAADGPGRTAASAEEGRREGNSTFYSE